MNDRIKFKRNQVEEILNVQEEFEEGALTDNLDVLIMDIGRNAFTVQGQSVRKTKFYKIAQKIKDGLYNSKKERKQLIASFNERFTSFLQEKGFSPDQISNLKSYYSQRISYGGMKVAGLMCNEKELVFFDPHQVACDLCLFETRVYFNSRFTHFHTKNTNTGKVVRNIRGTAHFHFQLTHDGFKFVQFSVDKDLRRNIELWWPNNKKIMECLKIMQQAQESNKIELFIFNSVLLRYYIGQTKLRMNRNQSEEETYNNMLIYFNERINPKIDFKKFDNDERHDAIFYEINNDFYKYLTHYSPAQTLLNKINDFLPDNASQRGLCEYQIEHATEIFQAQRELQNLHQAKIAFHLLRNIQHIILTTDWKVFFATGKKVKDDHGKEYTLPAHMKKILKIIQSAYEINPTGEDEIWYTSFLETAAIGNRVANKKASFVFRMFGINPRDKKAQELYDAFNSLITIRKLENKYKSPLKLVKV